MKLREDMLVIVRGIVKRPVESLLLVLGIALGIGAAASGISIVIQTIGESNRMLYETRYREIVVKNRESAAEMQSPAEQTKTGNEVFLTASDLAAKNDIQAVRYAYVANRENIDFRDFRNMQAFFRRNDSGTTTVTAVGKVDGTDQSGSAGVVSKESSAANQDKTSTGTARQTSTTTGGQDRSATGSLTSSSSADGQSNTNGNLSDNTQARGSAIGGPPPEFDPFDPNATPIPELKGPKPVIEEIAGYEVSPEYFPAYGLQADKGSLFTDDDIKKREPVMILGSEIAKTLFEDGVSLDRQVQVRRDIYRITGILKPTGTDLDMAGFIPIVIPDPNATDPRLRMRGWNTNLRFAVEDVSRLEQARAQLTSWFDKAYGEGTMVLSVPREEALDLANRNSRLVTIILILAISGLLIASVNVSNILFSRGLRKRKGIGIMKAMGATRWHIFSLFFTEALIIGLSGSVFGAGVAVLLSGLMKSSLGVGGYSIGILGLGVLLSLGTTLFLTNIPAVQTSKIPASEAIRYE